MFIERQHHPSIEFDPATGQQEPNLVFFFSNQVEPLKSALPLLAGGGDEERVLVVSSPLSELIDEAIRLHLDPDCGDSVVVDYKHWAYFEAVRASLQRAIKKIDQIQYAALDDENDGAGED